MPRTYFGISSSSSVFSDKNALNKHKHFRWESIQKFIYLAAIFSNHVYNFDMFSKICHTSSVKIIDFIFCQSIFGMAYLFMDCFIRQYTSRIDCGKFMNPLLRGVTFGLFLQTACNSVLQACYIADSFRFLVNTFHSEMPWLKCDSALKNVPCLSIIDIAFKCDGPKVSMNQTSAHIFYNNTFSHVDRRIITTRFFVVGLVWMSNFFIATVSNNTLLKLFFLVFVGRSLSTAVVVIFILISSDKFSVTAIIQLMDVHGPVTYLRSMEHITYTYGIGFLGFYDFGTMSPYTMIDTAVIMFSLIFTICAVMRSWIVRVLYLIMGECVDMNFYVAPHYLMFAILPLSTHFVRAHRLYTLYIYLNVTIGTSSYLTMLTVTMSKLLHSEFRSVKNVYIVGVLCFLGFGLSIPVTVSLTTSNKVKGLISGMSLSALYLGGFKAALVMWMYGVERFSTDIHFWLGFKPTKYWKLCWMLLPISLFYLLIEKILYYDGEVWYRSSLRVIIAYCWFALTVALVAIFNFKTITKYLLGNNLASLFRSSVKYGPPDPFDRERRRHYDDILESRNCNHNCQMIDELIDCNHMPLMQTSTSKYSVISAASPEVIIDFVQEDNTEFGTRTPVDTDHLNKHI